MMNPFRNRNGSRDEQQQRREGGGPNSSSARSGGDAGGAGGDGSSSTPTNYLSFSDANDDIIGAGSNNSMIDNSGSGSGGMVIVDALAVTARTSGTSSDEDDDDDSSLTGGPRGVAAAAVSIGESTAYRGFSTSIHDMFADTSQERIDCCAMTCCGMLQSDRDRFLLQGVTPPSLWKRFLTHIITPFCVFFLAGLGALHIRDAYLNQLYCVSMILLLIIYMIMQCNKGSHKRRNVRKDLLWTKYQLLQRQQRANNSRSRSSRDLDSRSGTSSPRDHAAAVLMVHARPDDEDDEEEYYIPGWFWSCCKSQAQRRGDPDYYLGQSRRDLYAAHPFCMCGFYPEDRSVPKMQADSAATGACILNCAPCGGAGDGDGNLCRTMWNHLCYPLWGVHVQCCGACALAQEARDLERVVLPPAYRRIDYITMQAYSDYYPAIYRNKWGMTTAGGGTGGQQSGGNDPEQGGYARQEEQQGGVVPGRMNAGNNIRYDPSFLPPLSKLAKHMIQVVCVLTAVLCAWSIVGDVYWKIVLRRNAPHRSFSVQDFLVFCAAWVSSILMVTFLAWLTNRPTNCRLSTDAMVKYFASGFVLSTFLSIVWEIILGLLVRAVVTILVLIAGIDVEAGNEYSSFAGRYEHHGMKTTAAWGHGHFGTTFLAPLTTTMPAAVGGKGDDSFLDTFGKSHPAAYTLYLLVEAFFLAALVEETCKYFGYRMIEHPDFLTKKELEEASFIVSPGVADDYDDDDGRNRAMTTRRNTSNEQRGGGGGGLLRLVRGNRQQQDEATPAADAVDEDYGNQNMSLQARGAAITLAMLCTAVGFTCCENLVYVFVYSRAVSTKEKAYVLAARAFFPVHVVAAAVQSLGVVRRDLERNRAIKFGTIIWPAVVFHGAYDFFILWIDFLVKREGVYVYADNMDGISALAAVVSFCISIACLGGAVFYYFIEAKKQRFRLIDMDRSVAVDRSSLI